MLTFSGDSVHVHSDLVLPADDLWLSALESGIISQDVAFARYSPVGLLPGDSVYTDALCCGRLTFEQDEKIAHVHLDGDFPAGYYLLNPGGDVKVAQVPYDYGGDGGTLALSDDLSIVARGYTIERRSANVASESDHSLKVRFERPPQTELATVPFSLRRDESDGIPLLGWLRSTPPARFRGVGVLLSIVDGLIVILPLLAWIVSTGPIRQSVRRYAAPAAALTATAFLGPATNACEDVLRSFELPYADLHPTIESVETSATFGVAFAIVLWIVARAGRARGERSTAAMLLRLCAVIAVAFAPIESMRWLARDRFDLVSSTLRYPLLLATAVLVAGVTVAGLIPRRIPRVTRRVRFGAFAFPAIAVTLLFIRNPWATQHGFADAQTIASEVASSASLIAFAFAAWVLATRDSAALNRAARAQHWVAATFLALGLGTAYPLVTSLPVSLLLSIPLCALLLRNQGAGPAGRGRYEALFDEGLRRVDLERANRALRQAEDNIYSPDSDPDRDKARIAALKARIEELAPGNLAELDAESLAFGGPMLGSPARGARAGFATGAIAGAVLLAFNSGDVRGDLNDAAVPAITLLSVLAQTVGTQALAGATFAVLLQRIRGRTALVKSVLVVSATTLATAPATLALNGLTYTLTHALAQVLVLGAVGAVADGWVLRKVTRPWFSTARLFGLAGLGAYAASSAILIGSVGAAATGALSDVVTQAVKRAAAAPFSSKPSPQGDSPNRSDGG
ncbi:MAG: hypothetical protein IAI49_01775 [Candidatus Eremiobacteraeota bacterium]|nr:hypothetical protein [Candidatus Eremiobacteraeota bacterium]